MKKELESLLTMGLSEKEVAIYKDLLEHGDSQTGKICNRTKIPSSNIYPLLERLLEKGMITMRLINNIKVFQAANPKVFLTLFEEKELAIKQEKTALNEAVQVLEKIKSKEQQGNDFKFFQGMNGIRSMYNEVMQAWKKEDECLIITTSAAFERLEPFFVEIVHKHRLQNQVKMRLLITGDTKKQAKKRERMKLTEVRYKQMKTQAECVLFQDKMIITGYGDKPYALMIQDRSTAETFKAYFEALWLTAQSE
ncbi:MAG: helix-turn-helix domain-containing protein [Nanoarchaeota archaeon]|nr:helix-turn-helix domain-containing protein [Nanoarchaeota archaeon]